MEFGLLNHDALWVMDEVQLMDVGLATATQLQAFREHDGEKRHRPCVTWWMSATLQPQWLARSPDTAAMAESLPLLSIGREHRVGRLWDGVSKPCTLEEISKEKELAQRIAQMSGMERLITVYNPRDREALGVRPEGREPMPTDRDIRPGEILRGRIGRGELVPRQPLPSESYLVGQYGVSRGTARRAVEVLREAGLVRTIPQRGSYVADNPPTG